jgi:hypothetical protein
MRELVRRVRDVFQHRMFEALTHLYRRRISDPRDLELATRHSWGERLRHLAAIARRTPYSQRLHLGLAQAYLVAAAGEDGDGRLTRRAAYWLRRVDDELDDLGDQRETRDRLIQLRGGE